MIKVRVWDKETKKMFVATELQLDIYDAKVSFVASEDLEENRTEFYDMDKIEIMQYVGSKDRNGREIYEGDIVRHHHNKNKTDYVVEWSDASFGFIAAPIKENPGRPHLNQATMLSYEIVGNIYENPELLGRKNEK